MKAQAGSFASRIYINQEEMKVMWDACLDKMEANPGELQTVAVHQEVPKQEAAVEMIVDLKDRPGDRHLAVRSRRQTKKRTHVDGGSRQKLAAARGPCHSCIAQGTRSSGTRKGRCCTRNS
jgi:hypothetical protein